MDNPRVKIVPTTFKAVSAMAMQMKTAIDAADREGEDIPDLVHLIDGPAGTLVQHACSFCLSQMQTRGQFAPMMTLLSRRALQIIALKDGVPQERIEQIMISSVLRTLIAVTSIGAYWLASEAWFATQSADAGVRKLQPREREDKREGMMIVAATASTYDVRLFETIRAADGKASDLRALSGRHEMDNPLLMDLFKGRDKIRAAARAMMSRP